MMENYLAMAFDGLMILMVTAAGAYLSVIIFGAPWWPKNKDPHKR